MKNYNLIKFMLAITFGATVALTWHYGAEEAVVGIIGFYLYVIYFDVLK